MWNKEMWLTEQIKKNQMKQDNEERAKKVLISGITRNDLETRLFWAPESLFHWSKGLLLPIQNTIIDLE